MTLAMTQMPTNRDVIFSRANMKLVRFCFQNLDIFSDLKSLSNILKFY